MSQKKENLKSLQYRCTMIWPARSLASAMLDFHRTYLVHKGLTKSTMKPSSTRKPPSGWNAAVSFANYRNVVSDCLTINTRYHLPAHRPIVFIVSRKRVQRRNYKPNVHLTLRNTHVASTMARKVRISEWMFRNRWIINEAIINITSRFPISSIRNYRKSLLHLRIHRRTLIRHFSFHSTSTTSP